jgi:hypothetical protein
LEGEKVKSGANRIKDVFTGDCHLNQKGENERASSPLVRERKNLARTSPDSIFTCGMMF